MDPFGTQWEYQEFIWEQLKPESQHVGPVHPVPPHWTQAVAQVSGASDASAGKVTASIDRSNSRAMSERLRIEILTARWQCGLPLRAIDMRARTDRQ